MNKKSNNYKNSNNSNTNQQMMNRRRQGSQNDLQDIAERMFSNFGMQRRDMGFNDDFFNDRGFGNFQNDFGDFADDDELFGG